MPRLTKSTRGGLANTASMTSTKSSRSWQADALLEQGDVDGRGVWLRVLNAVNELLAQEPAVTVH